MRIRSKVTGNHHPTKHTTLLHESRGSILARVNGIILGYSSILLNCPEPLPDIVLLIFLKVPSDSITPGWMFLKKWLFIISNTPKLNFSTRTGVITD